MKNTPKESTKHLVSVNDGVSSPRRVLSETLFQGTRELVITHNGRDYRLRLTQNGKLILTA